MGEDGWELHNALRARFMHAKEQGPEALKEFTHEVISERHESPHSYLFLGMAFYELGDEQAASRCVARMNHLVEQTRVAQASQDPRVACAEEANQEREARSWRGAFERRLKRAILDNIGLCAAALNEREGLEAVKRLHGYFASLAELLLAVRNTNIDPHWFERDTRLFRLILKAPVGINLSREAVGILSSCALIYRNLTSSEAQTILQWRDARSVIAFAHIPKDNRT